MSDKRIPIGLQIYSVRSVAADDLFGVLESVAKMGYDGVEFAGYYGHSAADIRKVLDDNGLVCCGTHTGMAALTDENFDETVNIHKTLGTQFVIIPWIPEEERNTSEACVKTAGKLTELTEKLEAVGLRLGFHAHGGDMTPLDGGQSAWQLLGEHTPETFIMQYDTANGMGGGADPVEPIRMFPGRALSTHLKEYKDGHGKAVVGEGDVPWTAVFEACETVGGTQWYVVEHEQESGDVMDAVARCLANLKAMGK